MEIIFKDDQGKNTSFEDEGQYNDENTRTEYFDIYNEDFVDRKDITSFHYLMTFANILNLHGYNIDNDLLKKSLDYYQGLVLQKFEVPTSLDATGEVI